MAVTSIPTKARQVVLATRPRINPIASDFRVDTVDLPPCKDGEILVRAIWLSVDPFMRLFLNEDSMAGPMPLNSLMPGSTVSEVMVSKHPGFAVGELLEGRTGWREYAVVNGAGLRKVEPSIAPLPLSAYLGALGMPGISAHIGMFKGEAKAGETVVVSGAGGAVGSIAGQIGKIIGCRVVGIAGGARKCAEVESLGFDACVDYRAADFRERLTAACPDRVDLYFDNVAGEVSQAVFKLFKRPARLALCGFMAYYGLPEDPPGPDRLPGFFKLLMGDSLRVFGFDWRAAAFPNTLPDLTRWVGSGQIKIKESVYEGLDQAPTAFSDLFASNVNIGKAVIRLGPDPKVLK